MHVQIPFLLAAPPPLARRAAPPTVVVVVSQPRCVPLRAVASMEVEDEEEGYQDEEDMEEDDHLPINQEDCWEVSARAAPAALRQREFLRHNFCQLCAALRRIYPTFFRRDRRSSRRTLTKRAWCVSSSTLSTSSS